MTREQAVKEFKEKGYNFSKLVFHAKSPYQSRRYKPEFVGWEAWLYNGKCPHGWLVTQEDFECEDNDWLLANVEAFNN